MSRHSILLLCEWGELIERWGISTLVEGDFGVEGECVTALLIHKSWKSLPDLRCTPAPWFYGYFPAPGLQYGLGLSRFVSSYRQTKSIFPPGTLN